MNLTDAQLLDQWRKRRDADAFAELVSRHADLVYATCLRMLRNSADAEDAAQECFVVLMKSRPAVGTSLAPWLHTVARRRALDIVRGRKRREQRELENAVDLAVSANRDTMDLLAWTDEAIAGLPDTLRVPVVERFLAGRKHGEIAAALGISEAAVRHRIGKGVDQIREALRRRGVPMTIAAIMATLETELAGAAPLALKAGLGKLAIVSPGTAVAPVWAAAGGLVAMKKIGVVLGVLAGLLIAGFLAVKTGDRPNDSETVVAEVGEGTVVEKVVEIEDLPEGTALPATVTDTPKVEGAAPEPERVLEPCEIADPANYASVSGHVRTEAGDPVAGAEVMLVAQGYEQGEDSNPTMEWAGRALNPEHHFRTRSESDGTFTLSGIRFRGQAIIYAYVNKEESAMQGRRNLNVTEGAQEERGDITLQAAVLIRGKVLSATGQPVGDAVVRSMFGDGVAPADRQGYFELAYESAHGIAVLSVYSPTNGMSSFSEIAFEPGVPITLTLPGAAHLRGHVEWRDGSPPTGLRVILQGSVVMSWQTGEDGSRTPGTSRNDMRYESPVAASGQYEISGIDPGQNYFRVSVTDESKVRYADAELGFLPANQVSNWDPVIAGTGYVFGSVLGEFSGENLRDADLRVWAIIEGKVVEPVSVSGDGTYRLQLPATDEEYFICPSFDPFTHNGFEAYGKKVRVKPGVETNVDLTFMERYTVSIRVVDELGQPIVGAEVLRRDPGHDGVVGTTDSAGRFTHHGMMPDFPNVDSLSKLVVRHPEYTNGSTLPRKGESGAVYPEETIVLYHKAGLVGRVVDIEGLPLAGATVQLEIACDPEGSVGIELHTNSLGIFRSEGNVPATTINVKVSVRHGDVWGAVLEMEPSTASPGGELDLGDLVFEPDVAVEKDDAEEVESK